MLVTKTCVSERGKNFNISAEVSGPAIRVFERHGYLSEDQRAMGERKQRERERLRQLSETKKEKAKQLQLELWGTA